MQINFDPQTNGLVAPARAGRPPSYLRAFLYLLFLELVIVAYSTVLGIGLAVFYIAPAIAKGMPFDVQALIQQLTEILLQGWSGLAAALPQFLLMIGFTWFWVKVIERRPFPSIGLAARRPLEKWARGMLAGALLFGLGLALAAVTGNLHWKGFAPAGVGQSLLWVGVTLAFYLIQGPAEEVMSRGYLLPTLTARGGPWVGILLSSVLFAAGHMLNPNISALGVINLVLYGVLAALYALREEGLWGIFGFHSAWNWVQGSVAGLEVSGANLSPAPLFSLATDGPSWWAGGSFGPEGGLIITITTLLGIAALLFWPARRTSESVAQLDDDIA